jgi:hypothetical protein
MGEEIRREAKWIEERDSAKDDLRRMMWSEPDRADEIERQTREEDIARNTLRTMAINMIQLSGLWHAMGASSIRRSEEQESPTN